MKSASKRLVVCGMTHHTSSVEQREPLQIGHEDIARANSIFFALPHVLESVIVSTCNRIEFYFVTDPDSEPLATVAEFYRQFNDFDIIDKADLFFTCKGSHAADHLFRVAAGIESMVLGENQIQGQLREAYSSACAMKVAGKVIHRLFHQAFRVGKLARSNTEMGKGACSVASAAMEMLKHHLPSEARPSVLFVGANQMIDLAASRLCHLHHGDFMFANRTEVKALVLAEKHCGEGYPLERLPDLLSRADVAITCTSATEPIIGCSMIDSAMSARQDRPLIILDLAIPRDVASGVDSRDGVAVHDLESIKTFVENQQSRRRDAVPDVEKIIEEKLAEFRYWWQHVKEEPLYNGQGTAIEIIVEEEMSKVVADLPDRLKNEMSHATRNIVRRVAEVARSGGHNQQENNHAIDLHADKSDHEGPQMSGGGRRRRCAKKSRNAS